MNLKHRVLALIPLLFFFAGSLPGWCADGTPLDLLPPAAPERRAVATPADLAAAKERKAEKVAAAKTAVDELEAARLEAVRKRQNEEAKQFAAELKAAKEQLAEAIKTPVETFAQQIVDERTAAEEENRQMQAARQAARQAAEQRAVEENAAKVAKDREEAERLQVSGGCPLTLKLTVGNFFHSRGVFSRSLGHPGPSTVASFTVVNPTGNPVQAYEMTLQFLDGFDKVIDEHKLQGALLESGDEISTINAFDRADTAMVMKVFIDRVKLHDDTIWERKPEHKRTIFTWKKPEGAGEVP